MSAADVDVLRFEQLAVAGRERLRAGDAPGAAAPLGEAVALWTEPPGTEPPGTEPATVAAVEPAAATRLAHSSVEAAADLAEAELALDNAAQAAARLTGLLAERPGYERAVALLMDALAAQGRQAEALARYEEFRETLADEFGTGPGAALRERHLRLLRAAQPAPVPTAPKAAGEAPNNLPVPLTSFIGRDDDLARIGTLLAEGRLVTVLGPGGAGKTRLAVEAARRHRDAYRDGAWLIDLASVTDPDKVGGAVLAAIGLRGAALFDASARPRSNSGDELDVLTDQLDGREILLVVDNCEHVIDAAAHLLSALLTRCAGLRVLATSREPLAIDGEALVPLGPLALPDPLADLQQARRTPSVRLFADRAAAMRPGFDITEDNLADVLRIVRSLDGLPLALELAAARLRTLTLTGLAEGLSDRFRLLTTGSRTAFPRHRTLRGVIAWSWDLLPTGARIVAERIAVLPGGITPASAAAVCMGTTVLVRDIPELLADLVDRSLLQLAPDTGRHRMLETIREYGLERLAEQNTLPSVQNLAAHYCADLVAHYDPLTRGPEQLHALHTLRGEHDNVLAALRHLCDTNNSDRAIALALDLTWYWQMLGRPDAAAYWLGEATAIPTDRPGLEHEIAEGLLLTSQAGQNALFSGSFKEGSTRLRTLAERLLSHGELPGFTGALVTIKLALPHKTQKGKAIIQRLAEGPDAWLAGYAHISRAHAAENEGDLDQARADATAALQCFTRSGDHWALATTLPLRSLLRQYDGELQGALGDLQEAKQLASEFGALSLHDEIYIDLRQFDLLVRLDQTARATELIATTRERALRSTAPGMAILLDAREARLMVQTGNLDRARQLIEAAESGLSTQLPLDDDHGRALIATVRAELCLQLADGPGAAHALTRAYTAAVNSQDLPIVATVAVTVAGLAELLGRHRDAAVTLGAAARLRGDQDRTDPHIRTLSTRTRTALGHKDFAEAYRAGWQLDATAALARSNPALVAPPLS
ncbi:ATP-binding protein [Streptomyces endocoffeicus]|uniref:ATP-binding protein n=1 Tax=Streptomyces endocoffeicus TaxID=2898945 RepID=UPI0027DB4D08|nr:BTAD domain-containing putative transcriptional regulator [Streptomyces endocoffeicus]